MLIRGDKDQMLPIEHSEKLEAALRVANAPVKLVRVTGADHAIQAKPELPDVTPEMVR